MPAVASKKSSDTRSRILEAALACFLEAGYEQTTIVRIRERSGVSNGTLFHRFPTKEAIADALYVESIASFHEGLWRLLARPPRSLRAAVHGTIAHQAQWIEANVERARFVYMRGTLEGDSSGGARLQQINRELADAYQAWLAPLRETGAVRSMRIAVLNAVVTGPTHAIARGWLAGQIASPLRDHVDELTDAACAALSGTPGRTTRAPAPLARPGRTRWHNRGMSAAGSPEHLAASYAQRIAEQEQRELSARAARSYPALRARPEEDCGLRTPFQRDRDRIVHCKAFRRLAHKTQVFIAPRGDHYRTRLTHTLEVTSISRTAARALRLNEDLTEAIGLGHDLGHPPFGHIGEEMLDRCLQERFGSRFRHYEHSLRVVDRLERDGAGLNLTEQVRDGIARHSSGAADPSTLEGRIVRIIDRVAYINHDIDDALRAGLLDEADLPARAIATLGATGSQRIDALVHDMVEHSARAGEIVQGDEAGGAMAQLRSFMFERVYLGPAVRAEHRRIEEVIKALFEHYVEHPQDLPPALPAGGIGGAAGGAGRSGAVSGTDDSSDADAQLAQRVTDYLAGMTDRFCIRAYTDLKVPKAFAR